MPVDRRVHPLPPESYSSPANPLPPPPRTASRWWRSQARQTFPRKEEAVRASNAVPPLLGNQLFERSLKQKASETHVACRKCVAGCLIGDQAHTKALGIATFNL